MNLPTDRVHHIAGGFGRLVLPWFGQRWLIWFDGKTQLPSLPKGLKLMDCNFHNCRATGVE